MIPLIYVQRTGRLYGPTGEYLAQCYSGHGEGKNNPGLQNVEKVGPLPCGDWTISGPPVDTDTHGPFVLTLTPCPGIETFGRSAFRIHGDSKVHPGEASEGCIVTTRPSREAIWDLALKGSNLLRVVAEEPARAVA